MRRTQQSSIEALEKAIEEQKNTRDFNYIMPTEQVPNFCFERESPEDM